MTLPINGGLLSCKSIITVCYKLVEQETKGNLSFLAHGYNIQKVENYRKSRNWGLIVFSLTKGHAIKPFFIDLYREIISEVTGFPR